MCRRSPTSRHPLCAHPPRAGGVVHGRDVWPGHRAGGGGVRDARPGRDQHAAGCRRRHDQQHTVGGDLGPGGPEPGSTRNRTSTSTWCRCSRRSPGGPPVFRLRRRYRRWSAKRSRSPRPSVRRRSISPSPNTSTSTKRTIPTWVRCRATLFARMHRRFAKWRVLSTCCARPSARWCWPDMARRAPARPPPWCGSPRSSAFRWPTPSTAKA